MIWLRQHLAEILLIIIIFIPRLPGLNVFLTPDEPLFLEHARDMAAAFTSGDFSQTLGIGYPGVTGAGLAAPFVANIPDSMAAYAAGRFPVVLFGALLLLVLYALARRLLGRWPALIGVSLLALDPYTLAYSRLLHIGAPFALLMTLAGLSWLLWLRVSIRIWLLLTGRFTALALLTKSTALLLGPMLAVVTLSWVISRNQWRSRRWWFIIVAGAAVSILLAAVIFFLLWPAMWVVPGQALRLTFGKLFTDQEAGTGNLGMFWFGQFVQDPGPAF
jgi:4-amino-4-deoxy-L-arabinose transferase-like glycosyltransferase